MNAWIPRNISLPQAPTIGASQTDVPVSKKFTITHGGSTNLVISIKASSVTAGAGITAKLRSQVGVNTPLDSKSVSITSNGMSYIKLNINISGDQTYLPLLSIGEVVLSTGVGSSIMVDEVNVLQED